MTLSNYAHSQQNWKQLNRLCTQLLVYGRAREHKITQIAARKLRMKAQNKNDKSTILTVVHWNESAKIARNYC